MSMYTEEHKIPSPTIKLRRKINFSNNKNYCCGRCQGNSFELVESKQTTLKAHLVCAKCRAIANEDVNIIIDKNPSHLLMSLRSRKYLEG